MTIRKASSIIGNLAMRVVRSAAYRSQRIWLKWRTSYRRRRYRADHVGKRVVGVKRHVPTGGSVFEKRFDDSVTGRQALAREIEARTVFGDRAWMTPIVRSGGRTLAFPLWPEEARLDRLLPKLSGASRGEIAAQAVEILFDIFSEGYAHCDFHARNLFWVKHQLRVIDFEALQTYPAGQRPPFPCSYDLVGEGLSPPYGAPREYFGRQNGAVSLGVLLGLSPAEAATMIEERLRQDLWSASVTFQARTRRHTCAAGLIYNSFTLPHFGVSPAEAQRNSARRCARFELTEETVRGRTVLDLGSNIGGMLFEMQRLQPKSCLGVEYDIEKVRVAREVTAYNGLRNLSFIQADIDQLSGEAIDAPYDIVLCLAIVEHVKRTDRLFQLLAEVTARELYFEGNSGTNRRLIERRLKDVGFRVVEFRGISDDDVRPQNNRRPLWRAVR